MGQHAGDERSVDLGAVLLLLLLRELERLGARGAGSRG